MSALRKVLQWVGFVASILIAVSWTLNRRRQPANLTRDQATEDSNDRQLDSPKAKIVELGSLADWVSALVAISALSVAFITFSMQIEDRTEGKIDKSQEFANRVGVWFTNANGTGFTVQNANIMPIEFAVVEMATTKGETQLKDLGQIPPCTAISYTPKKSSALSFIRSIYFVDPIKVEMWQRSIIGPLLKKRFPGSASSISADSVFLMEKKVTSPSCN